MERKRNRKSVIHVVTDVGVNNDFLRRKTRLGDCLSRLRTPADNQDDGTEENQKTNAKVSKDCA